MKSNQDFKWSQKEVCVMGYSAAGWTPLNKYHKELGKEVFGYGNSPLKPQESYYYQAHPVHKTIPDLKRLFMERNAAEELLTNFDSGLTHHQKNVLISFFNMYAKDYPHVAPQIDELGDGRGTLRQSLEKVGVSIRDFFRALFYYTRNDYGENVEQPLDLMARVVELTHGFIKDRLSEVIDNEFQGLQDSIWASKRAIADVFQVNIRRRSQEEPLIPIEIVISSDQTAVAATFQPNADDMREKRDNFVTPHELRMMYKLMYELPDKYQDQMQMMRASVTCLERKSDGTFKPVAAPWEALPVQWAGRPRGQRGESKASYKERGPMPSWLSGILENEGVGPETPDDQGAASVTRPRP